MMRVSLLFLTVLLSACSRKPAYTEDDVRQFVLPGTAREAIIRRFGEPTFVEKDPKFEDGSTPVDEIIYFHLPLEQWRRSEREVFVGFQVGLKAARAVDWHPTYGR